MEKKQVSSRRKNRRERRIARLVLISFVGVSCFAAGKITTPAKVETVTQVKTVEVPRYQKAELPEKHATKYLDIPLSHNLQDYVTEICADEKVPVSLVYAMIEHESQFNPEQVSKTDDYGLMQINTINEGRLQEEYRSADLLNPYQNIFCGVKIIGSYLKKYNQDYTKALMAYNMGDYGASKAWESGISSSSYSESILSLMDEYEQELSNDK